MKDLTGFTGKFTFYFGYGKVDGWMGRSLKYLRCRDGAFFINRVDVGAFMATPDREHYEEEFYLFFWV